MHDSRPRLAWSVPFLWSRLVEVGILRVFNASRQDYVANHEIDVRALYIHLRDETFRNLFHPVSILHSRYSGAVVAIDVLRGDDEHRGSGFIAQPNLEGPY